MCCTAAENHAFAKIAVLAQRRSRARIKAHDRACAHFDRGPSVHICIAAGALGHPLFQEALRLCM